MPKGRRGSDRVNKQRSANQGIIYFNAPDGEASHRASEAFIQALRQELHQGYGIVPLIGAGFSVTAGIPIIQQLTNYLQRCICVALGAEDEGAALWNPRTDRWPPFVDRLRNRTSEWWLRRMNLKYLQEKAKWDEDQGTVDPKIYLEAIGAMAEWRTALTFLSRIILLPGRGNETTRPQLVVPERQVVDACFREVMARKRPTLNHKMLASLSGLLRIDLILTTNFDDLVERAFAAAKIPLETLDVHINDRLPDWTALTQARSIIKMHGSQNSLRADYSLDDSPTQEEKHTFCEYLAAKQLSVSELLRARLNRQLGEILDKRASHIASDIASKASESSQLAERKYTKAHIHDAAKEAFRKFLDERNLRVAERKEVSSSHLLLMGVGARERRTVDFVFHAYSALDNLKVFWICYSDKEFDNIKERISEASLSLSKGRSARIFVLRHTDAGLLMLHLYQSVRKSLPPAGSIFPSATSLAIPPLPWSRPLHTSKSATCSQLSDFLTLQIDPRRQHSESVVILYGADTVSGVASAAAETFRSLERDNTCLWLDLGDIHSADGVFEAFQEAAYYKLAESDWTPLYSQKDEQALGRQMPLHSEIRRIVESSTRPWIVFLNAREKPGSNRDDRDELNGWMDLEENPENRTANREGIYQLLSQFVLANEADAKAAAINLEQHESARQTKRVTIVLICTSNRANDSALLNNLHVISDLVTAARGSSPAAVSKLISAHVGHGLPLAATPSQVVNDVLTWTEGRDVQARRRFLQVLVLMQRPRHLAVAWSKSTNVEKTLVSSTDNARVEWLEELEARRLLRRLDGGFIWLQARCREALRRCLSLTDSELQEDAKSIKKRCKLPELSDASISSLIRWSASEHQADVHLSLSVWFRKVFDATGSSQAIFDAADHLCFSADSLIRYPSTKAHPSRGTFQDLEDTERLQSARERIDAARDLIGEHQYLIQTHGHPRASLRRLDFLRDYWVRDRGELKSPRALLETVTAWGHDVLPVMELDRAIARLQSVLTEVSRAICREIGELEESFARHREAGIRALTPKPMTTAEVYSRLAALPGRLSEAVAKSIGEVETDRASAVNPRSGSSDRRFELVRWWRWCGLLGISARCLEMADRSLARALCLAKAPSLQFIEEPPKLYEVDLTDWVLQVDAAYKFKLETLYSLEQASYCLVLQAGVCDREIELFKNKWKRPEAQHLDVEAKKKAFLESAQRFADKGLAFVDDIVSSGQAREDHDFELMWCKSRLLMQAALTSMVRPSGRSTGRHATSLLSDAASCLSNATPERWSSDLGLVELRRAEIRLQEAAAIKIYTVTKGSPPLQTGGYAFGSWVLDRLFGENIYERVTVIGDGGTQKRMKAPLRVAEDLRRQYSGRQRGFGEDRAMKLRMAIREIRGRAVDAVRFLDAAEPILRERRRNVWWTTWYFERRLRAIAMLLWISVVEVGEPIPFLGLEAAMRLSDTVADTLLNDTLRMMRLDSYRLAMVLLYYASCARALQIRLILEQQDQGPSVAAVRLDERLLTMRARLRSGIEQLRDVIEVRNKDVDRRYQLSQSVNELVEEIMVRVENVLSGLSEENPRGATVKYGAI